PTCRLARDRRGELLAVTLDQLGEHQSVAVPLLGRGELRWRRIPAFPLPSGTPTIQLRDPLVAVDLEGGEEGGVARRGRGRPEERLDRVDRRGLPGLLRPEDDIDARR